MLVYHHHLCCILSHCNTGGYDCEECYSFPKITPKPFIRDFKFENELQLSIENLSHYFTISILDLNFVLLTILPQLVR